MKWIAEKDSIIIIHTYIPTDLHFRVIVQCTRVDIIKSLNHYYALRI